MKSRAIKVFNYRDVPFEKKIVVEGVKDEVDGLVRSIVKHYKKKIQADKIENDDIVMLKCESKTPKFNKSSIPVSIGKGLFDKELENIVLGMKVDEEKEITIDNEKVKVKVIAISRTFYPELTDEMVQEYVTGKDEKYGDAKTAQEYIKIASDETFEDMKEQAIYNVINDICIEVFEKSQWSFDENELKEYGKFVFDTEAGFMLQEGIDVNKLETEDDYIRAFGDVRNREELDELVANTARDTTAMYLMACEWMNINPETIDLYNEDEAPNITDMLYNYVKENITFIKEGI